MKRENLQELKKFLVRTVKGISVSSTFDDIEEWLLEKTNGNEPIETKFNNDYVEETDEIQAYGTYTEEHFIEIMPSKTKIGIVIIFSVYLTYKTENGQNELIGIKY